MLYIDLQNILREKNAFLIDVRSKESYNSFHLEEAISIPLEQIDLQIDQIFPNKNQHIYIICDYGIKSDKAYSELIKKGYVNIMNLNKISNIIF